MNPQKEMNTSSKKFDDYGKKYAIKMMLKLSNNYYDSAVLLQESNKYSLENGEIIKNQSDYDTGDACFFVSILCLEILMKIIVAYHNDNLPRTHNYRELFKNLSPDVKNSIMFNIRKSMLHNDSCYKYFDFNEACFCKLLNIFMQNYTKLRYCYEDYFYRTEDEIEQLIKQSDEQLEKAIKSQSIIPIYMNDDLSVDCLYCGDSLGIIISSLREYCSNVIEPFVCS